MVLNSLLNFSILFFIFYNLIKNVNSIKLNNIFLFTALLIGCAVISVSVFNDYYFLDFTMNVNSNSSDLFLFNFTILTVFNISIYYISIFLNKEKEKNIIYTSAVSLLAILLQYNIIFDHVNTVSLSFLSYIYIILLFIVLNKNYSINNFGKYLVTIVILGNLIFALDVIVYENSFVFDIKYILIICLLCVFIGFFSLNRWREEFFLKDYVSFNIIYALKLFFVSYVVNYVISDIPVFYFYKYPILVILMIGIFLSIYFKLKIAKISSLCLSNYNFYGSLLLLPLIFDIREENVNHIQTSFILLIFFVNSLYGYLYKILYNENEIKFIGGIIKKYALMYYSLLFINIVNYIFILYYIDLFNYDFVFIKYVLILFFALYILISTINLNSIFKGENKLDEIIFSRIIDLNKEEKFIILSFVFVSFALYKIVIMFEFELLKQLYSIIFISGIIFIANINIVNRKISSISDHNTYIKREIDEVKKNNFIDINIDFDWAKYIKFILLLKYLKHFIRKILFPKDMFNLIIVLFLLTIFLIIIVV